MNTTSGTVSSSLLAAPYQLNRWMGLFLWVAGNLGCVGNMIVYSSQLFRRRAYGVYLLAEAMSSLIYFNFLLLTRVLQRGYQIPIITRSELICKLRQFDSVWNHVVSVTLFSFAIIDRILSFQRSNTYRQWSNRVGLAYKMCAAGALFWLLFFGHRLILYSIRNGQCGPLPGFYAYFDNYSEASFTAMSTPIVMSILGFLLLRSVRDVIRRQVGPHNTNQPVGIAQQTTRQRIDSQLTFMLMLQICIAIVTRIPYASQLIYTNITQNWPKSALQVAIENVIIEFNSLLAYTFFTFSFYISLTTNNGFRRQFMTFFRKRDLIEPKTQ